jgi:hypothetical protein
LCAVLHFCFITSAHCYSIFLIPHAARSGIGGHLRTKRRSRYLSSAFIEIIISFFKHNSVRKNELNFADAEGIFAYQYVKNFRSSDCSSELISRMFYRNFPCSRTKSEAAATNVLRSHVKNCLRICLKAPFVAVKLTVCNRKMSKTNTSNV